jgi:3-deoxy-7-phosphoheptulonate synthase
MLVVMQADATPGQIDAVCGAIRDMGFEPVPMPGAQRTAVGLIGNDGQVDGSHISGMAGVGQVLYVSKPYKQVSREWRPDNTVVEIAPASRSAARGRRHRRPVLGRERGADPRLRARGARGRRGARCAGAPSSRAPRPYSFQGMGLAGLKLLAQARDATGLAIVTEAMDEEGANLVAEWADCIQIGARNMQNFSLLKVVGRLGKPVLLKRGMSATIQELLLAAEYVLAAGNPHVILCERGVRGFDTATRNLFDLSAIPLVHKLSHLPIVADPSHGVGVREHVPSMARAAVAAGADGLIIEVHPNPDRAMSDGAQTLFPDQFERLMREVGVIAQAIDRSVAPPSPRPTAAGIA